MPGPPAGGAAKAPEAQGEAWYRPTTADDKLPWNKHNPWGSWDHPDPVARGAISASLHVAGHFFQTGLDGAGAEYGVRFGGVAFGVTLGRYSPSNLYVAGIDLWPSYGKILYDAQIPDIQAGLLLPEVQLRAVFDSKAVVFNGNLGVLGARVVIEDAIRVDVRPLIGVWKGRRDAPAVSAGLSFEAGVAF
jgi:hypothetical protein